MWVQDVDADCGLLLSVQWSIEDSVGEWLGDRILIIRSTKAQQPPK